MAVRRGEIGQFLALLLIFIGTMLLVASGGFYYLGASYGNQIPVNINQNLSTRAVSQKSKMLSVCSLLESHARVLDAKIHGNRKLISVKPSDLGRVTYQMSSVLVADSVFSHGRQRDLEVNKGDLGEKPCFDAVVSGQVDLVTVNRKTGLPVHSDTAKSAIRLDPTRAARVIADREGITYRFPTHVNSNAHYKFFDPLTEQTLPIEYKGTENIGDVEVYHYVQDVPERDLSELTLKGRNISGEEFESPPVGTVLVKPASWWRIKNYKHLGARARKALMMHRFGSVKRDIWVEPQSGVIIKTREDQKEEYHLRANSPLATSSVANYKLTAYEGVQETDQHSIDQSTQIARDINSHNKTGLTVVPAILALAAVLVLITGILLFIRESKWHKKVQDYVYSLQFDS